jgi:hypothetical protein
VRLLYSITSPTSGSLNLFDRKAKQYRVVNYETQEVVGVDLTFDEARLMTIDKTNEALRLGRMLGEVAA